MNVPQIYAAMLLDSGANIVDYPIATAILHLNFVYKDLMEEINKLNENYFYKRFFLTTVPFQNKYALPVQWTGIRAIKKINAVNVLYQLPWYPDFVANTPYTKGNIILRSVDQKVYIAKIDQTEAVFDPLLWEQIFTGYSTATDMAIDQMNDNALNMYPYATLNDPSFLTLNDTPMLYPKFWHGQDRDLTKNTTQWCLYIYPYVTNIIPQGIIIDAIGTVTDLTITSAEVDIFLEPDYHSLLVLWRVRRFYKSAQKIDYEIRAKAEYDAQKAIVLSQITDRVESPWYVILPALPRFR